MESFKQRRQRIATDSDIDLTPMLDVVFIMLIFFIVTASFVRESGLVMSKESVTPSTSNADAPQDIVFRITASNEIWLNDRRIDLRSVRANVERMRAENPKARVILRAHEDSYTETFVAVVDASREAGIYDIGFAAVK